MILTPFTKKIEIDAGFKGFYKIENERCTVTVNEHGIKLVSDNRTGIPNGTGVVKHLFKPMLNVYEAKKYAETMPELKASEALKQGFSLVGEVETN
jgi:hypothetical protein